MNQKKAYRKPALLLLTILMLFLTASSFLPTPEKLQECPDGWKDGGSVCYKGDGCPSWVCREYRNVCEKFVIATCMRSQYVCKWDEETSQKICSIQPSYYKCAICVSMSIRCQAACFLK